MAGMAKNFRKQPYQEKPSTTNLALALSISLSFFSGICLQHAAQATDANAFAHPKQLFVPPSTFHRRYDSDYEDYQSYPNTGHQNTEPSADGSTPTKFGSSTPSPYTTGKIPPSSVTGKAGQRPSTIPGAKGLGTRNKTLVESSKFTDARRGANTGGAPHSTPATTTFVSQAIAKSQALVNAGKLAAAEDMLQTDVKAFPSCAELQNELANVQIARARFYLKNQDIPQAAQEARSAITHAPNNQTARTLLGEITSSTAVVNADATEHIKSGQSLASQSKFLEAKAEYDTAISIQPSAPAYVGLGDLAAQQGDKALAKQQYAKAFQIDSESSLALRQRGIFKLASENDVVGANQDLSRALILNPTDTIAAAALQQLWREQIAKNPASANPHLGLARAFQLSNDLKSAQAEYREVVRLDPQHPNLPAARQSFKLALAKQEATRCLQAAHTLEDSGALNDAHFKILEAVNLTPTSISARLYQGSVAEKLTLYKEAHDAYMTVLREDPRNQIAANHLRNLNSQLGASNANPAEMAAKSAVQNVSGVPAYPTTTMAGPDSATAATTPTKPQGMYAFRGWQKGSPFPTPPAQPADTTASATGAPINPNIEPVDASSGTLANSGKPMPLQGPSTLSPTTQHVNAFSSFLGSLRDVNMQNQQNAMAAESVMRSAVSPYGSSYPSSTGSSPSASSYSSSTGSSGASGADLNNLLSSINSMPSAPSAATAGSAPVPGGATAAGADSAATNSSAFAIIGAMANRLRGPLTHQPSSTSTAAAGATPAPAAATQSAMPPTSISALSRELTPQQIQQIQQMTAVPAPLPTMPDPAEANILANAGADAPSSLPPEVLPQTAGLTATAATLGALPPATGSITQAAASTASSATAPAATVNSAPVQNAGVSQDNSAATTAMATSSVASSLNGSIKLELEGVSPTPTSVKLKVVLKNDGSQPLTIPATPTAIVRIFGQSDQKAQVIFTDKQVAVGGVIHGIIKIAGHNINPAADLVLPGFLPAAFADRDVHLTVPISALVK
jgi:tetratricopeptide (TPR) repeat protein